MKEHGKKVGNRWHSSVPPRVSCGDRVAFLAKNHQLPANKSSGSFPSGSGGVVERDHADAARHAGRKDRAGHTYP